MRRYSLSIDHLGARPMNYYTRAWVSEQKTDIENNKFIPAGSNGTISILYARVPIFNEILACLSQWQFIPEILFISSLIEKSKEDGNITSSVYFTSAQTKRTNEKMGRHCPFLPTCYTSKNRIKLPCQRSIQTDKLWIDNKISDTSKKSEDDTGPEMLGGYNNKECYCFPFLPQYHIASKLKGYYSPRRTTTVYLHWLQYLRLLFSVHQHYPLYELITKVLSQPLFRFCLEQGKKETEGDHHIRAFLIEKVYIVALLK